MIPDYRHLLTPALKLLWPGTGGDDVTTLIRSRGGYLIQGCEGHESGELVERFKCWPRCLFITLHSRFSAKQGSQAELTPLLLPYGTFGTDEVGLPF